MNAASARLRKNLFFLVPILVGIAYLGSTVLSSSSKSSQGTVKVNNLTRSCEILSAEKHNGHVKISFRNNSDKAITAYLFSNIEAKLTSTVLVEFAFSETGDVISPGQTYDRVMDIPGNLAPQDEVVFNLAAIMLEGDTGEGDPKILRDIKDYRLGKKIQLMKALPVLDKLLYLSETDLISHWRKAAKHDFEAALNVPDADVLIQLGKKPLNNDEPDDESPFASGVQQGKAYVLRKHQEIIDETNLQGTSGLQQEIIRLRDLYAKMIARD